MLSRSSVKAKYRGVANVVVESCWLTNLLRELLTPFSSVTLFEFCMFRLVINHGFVGYPFDYRVTLGFGSIAGGTDHVNHVIRLPLEHGISRVLGLDDYSNPSIGTNPVTASIT
ncbi:hypothetical protein Tco_1536217 [Tanacetum coccineum]